jgi:hypothetical protein
MEMEAKCWWAYHRKSSVFKKKTEMTNFVTIGALPSSEFIDNMQEHRNSKLNENLAP